MPEKTKQIRGRTDIHLLGILRDVRATTSQRLQAVRILTALHLDRLGKKDLAMAMLTGKLINEIPEPYDVNAKAEEIKKIPPPPIDSF